MRDLLVSSTRQQRTPLIPPSTFLRAGSSVVRSGTPVFPLGDQRGRCLPRSIEKPVGGRQACGFAVPDPSHPMVLPMDPLTRCRGRPGRPHPPISREHARGPRSLRAGFGSEPFRKFGGSRVYKSQGAPPRSEEVVSEGFRSVGVSPQRVDDVAYAGELEHGGDRREG